MYCREAVQSDEISPRSRRDTSHLIHREAHGVLGGGQRVESAVGPADSEQRAAHDTVRVTMDLAHAVVHASARSRRDLGGISARSHQMIERIRRGDGYARDRVGECKRLRHKCLERLRDIAEISPRWFRGGGPTSERLTLCRPTATLSLPWRHLRDPRDVADQNGPARHAVAERAALDQPEQPPASEVGA